MSALPAFYYEANCHHHQNEESNLPPALRYFYVV